MNITVKGLIIFPIHFCLQMINLSVCALMIVAFVPLKFLLPFESARQVINAICSRIMARFGINSVLLIKLFNRNSWDYQIHGELRKDQWYLMVANHLSYLDIILLIEFAAKRMPTPKFFVKKELIWLPFVGVAAWAMEMPFMQRYSREFIAKNPHLKGKDLETTRQFCEKFRTIPTTVINFVEGSRFTPAKHKQKNSDYQHLLPPKAGGIAFTLGAMGELFNHMVDVTLIYPDSKSHIMFDMLCGNLGRVIVHVRVLPIEEQMIGDYHNDPEFQQGFQGWLNQFWRGKDRLLNSLVNG